MRRGGGTECGLCCRGGRHVNKPSVSQLQAWLLRPDPGRFCGLSCRDKGILGTSIALEGSYRLHKYIPLPRVTTQTAIHLELEAHHQITIPAGMLVNFGVLLSFASFIFIQPSVGVCWILLEFGMSG